MDQFFLLKLNVNLENVHNQKYLLKILKSKELINLGIFFESSEDIFCLKNLPLIDKAIFFNSLGHKIIIIINDNDQPIARSVNIKKEKNTYERLRLMFGNDNFFIKKNRQEQLSLDINSGYLKVCLFNVLDFANYRERFTHFTGKDFSVLSIKQLSHISFSSIFINTKQKRFFKEILELSYDAVEELSSFLFYNDLETQAKNVHDLSINIEICHKKVICKVLASLCKRIPVFFKPELVYEHIFKKISHKNMVSIIVPTYNGMDFLPEAIKSVTDQFYKNIELVIIDDGSFDGTKQYCKEIIKKSKSFFRIRYFYQKNKGVAAARNLGIKKAKGSLIVMLDHDDYLLPDSIIDRVVPFLINKKIKVVYAKRDTLVNEGYGRIRQQRAEPYQTDGFTKLKSNKEQFKYLLKKQVAFGFNTMMYRKSIFKKIGYFLEDRKYSGLEHNAFLIRTLYRYYAEYVDSVVYLMRRNHSNNHLSKRFENNLLRRKLLQEHIFPIALSGLKINYNEEN